MIELVAVGMVGLVACALLRYGRRIGAASAGRTPAATRDEGPSSSPTTPPGELETELRQALHSGDFMLRYEPIVELATGRIAAFEAVVHWRHWALGLIRPGEFLPVAEKTGLAVPLGAWVLEEACRKMASWRARFPEAGDLSVAVNLSARELAEPGLVERVAGSLAVAGLSPARLVVEATEAATADPVAMANLDALAALGVGLTLDRFGTGSSSLEHLRGLPVRAVKLDRGLVATLVAGGREAAIAAGYLDFGRDLGVAVAADGVETADQLAALSERHCGYAQGFLIGGLMDATEVDAFLQRRLRATRLVGLV